jgi:hypothetical protein
MFSILPRVSYRVRPTRNSLSAENYLVVFLPQVTSFPLFPRVTPFPPGKLFVIRKLFVICEIRVGLAHQYFSREFVCSPTIFWLDNTTTNQKSAFAVEGILRRAHDLGGMCGVDAIPSFGAAS